MSPRRGRQIVAPGVSPGVRRLMIKEPRRGDRYRTGSGSDLVSTRATRYRARFCNRGVSTLCRPLRGAHKFFFSTDPRAYARGYYLPPAYAGSLNDSISDTFSNVNWLSKPVSSDFRECRDLTLAVNQKPELQPEQAAAAYEITRHISVTAGPGSGKTTVLVERYLHILRERKLSIDQIVAITFTNRAANEMRERLNKLIPAAAERISVTTFHGLGQSILREHGQRIGLRADFRIASLVERKALLVEKLTLSEREAESRLKRISRLKRVGIAVLSKPSAAGGGLLPAPLSRLRGRRTRHPGCGHVSTPHVRSHPADTTESRGHEDCDRRCGHATRRRRPAVRKAPPLGMNHPRVVTEMHRVRPHRLDLYE